MNHHFALCSEAWEAPSRAVEESMMLSDSPGSKSHDPEDPSWTKQFTRLLVWRPLASVVPERVAKLARLPSPNGPPQRKHDSTCSYIMCGLKGRVQNDCRSQQLIDVTVPLAWRAGLHLPTVRWRIQRSFASFYELHRRCCEFNSQSQSLELVTVSLHRFTLCALYEDLWLGCCWFLSRKQQT